MALRFEKFPVVRHLGKAVVWDSRQPIDPQGEWVVIPPDLDERVQTELEARPNAEFVEGPQARATLAAWSAAHYGDPSASLKILAVTGTNGKSTCVALLRQILAEAGHRVAQMGTLGVSVWQGSRVLTEIETGFTTPEAPQLQHLLRQLVDMGVTHVAMEVSSHALALRRADATYFKGALFTNLTQDHLDFHGDMKQYLNAKRRLFIELLPRSGAAVAVLNTGDLAGRELLKTLPLGLKVIAFNAAEAKILRSDLSGMEVALPGLPPFFTPLVGAYNVENLCGVWTLLRESCALSGELFTSALKNFQGAAGRLQRVPDSKGRFVFVDYAHTPDALEKVLQNLRTLKAPSARLSVVFGCGGDRDSAKRPLMGAAALRGADQVVVTSDNPRGEDPQKIIAEITAGMAPSSVYYCEVDRRQAIVKAVRDLRAGDVLVVAGKGHEKSQIVKGQKLHFDDVEECAKALNSDQS